MALFRRKRPQAPPLPVLLVVSYAADAGRAGLAHTFVFSDLDGHSYTKLRVLDAFGSEVALGTLA